MEIIISNSNNSPIYEQLYTQIKNLIISDSLKEGESLPSIRNLAKDLKVSVVTTKKAYDALESEGYINTMHGKGSFVAAKNTEILRETKLKEIEDYMEKIMSIAPSCNLDDDQIIEMFKIFIKENQ